MLGLILAARFLIIRLLDWGVYSPAFGVSSIVLLTTGKVHNETRNVHFVGTHCADLIWGIKVRGTHV